jgi:uncharacterized protein YfaP (DUF2135 family)
VGFEAWKVLKAKIGETVNRGALSEKRCLNCGCSLPSSAKFCINCGSTSLQTVYYYAPPPPPPPEFVPPKTRKRGSTKKIALVIATALIIVTLIISAVFVFPGVFPASQQGGDSDNTSQQGDVVMTIGAMNKAVETGIGTEGGTISVTDTASPLYGLRIEFPESATTENVNVVVSYADVLDISGLPENNSVASKLIKIETSGSAEWDETKHFQSPILVTLPYEPVENKSEPFVRFYYYDREHQILDSAGFVYENLTARTVSFYTASFSEFIGINWKQYLGYGWDNAWSTSAFDVDTGFRPATNGWFLANDGSYIDPGGYCLGMVAYAKWFYRHKTVSNWKEEKVTDEGGNEVVIGSWNLAGPRLYDKYREGDLNEWRDDATAIQLASRAQMAAEEVVRKIYSSKEQYSSSILNQNRLNSKYVALTWLHGMIVTHEPQIITLRTVFENGEMGQDAHAILVYRYENGRFDVYDPNFPGTFPGTDARQIPFTWASAFTRAYVSSINAKETATQFNFFMALGWKVFASNSFYEGLYEAAEKKFEDDTIFPKVAFTSEHTSILGTTPEDTNGDGIRDTNQLKTTISGTITGGQAGAVGDGVIFVSNRQFPVALEGQYPDYSFAVEVPLYQGDNEVFFISSYDLYSNWAGFLKDTIRCNATKANFTVTLTWREDHSDVDLHVLEPTIGETVGRHIYYSNTGGYAGGLYPYLDIDNRIGGGVGPEHYYAAEDMTLPNYQGSGTSLYGVYKIRVQYYRDKDDDENHTQTIHWTITVKYLAFRIEQTGQEFWIEKPFSGELSTDNAYGTSDFFSSDASWSNIIEIEYPAPNPNNYKIPSPPQNKLPQ